MLRFGNRIRLGFQHVAARRSQLSHMPSPDLCMIHKGIAANYVATQYGDEINDASKKVGDQVTEQATQVAEQAKQTCVQASELGAQVGSVIGKQGKALVADKGKALMADPRAAAAFSTLLSSTPRARSKFSSNAMACTKLFSSTSGAKKEQIATQGDEDETPLLE